MTTTQVFLTGAAGGIAGVIGMGLFVVLVVLAFEAVDGIRRIPEALRVRRERLRARRADYDACRAIDALPPVHRPGDRK
ncbi:hypothetical protein AB0D38_36830 [Streptomyces sp. NPDC048279]|uniref:hypothetical protein n=1 Tax=Streptomyces sp. NPDC048279 TaxID=3154714 RepID=UPI00342392EA